MWTRRKARHKAYHKADPTPKEARKIQTQSNSERDRSTTWFPRHFSKQLPIKRLYTRHSNPVSLSLISNYPQLSSSIYFQISKSLSLLIKFSTSITKIRLWVLRVCFVLVIKHHRFDRVLATFWTLYIYIYIEHTCKKILIFEFEFSIKEKVYTLCSYVYDFPTFNLKTIDYQTGPH